MATTAKSVAKAATMVVLGTALAPVGGGEWVGDDGACELRVRYLRDGRVRAALYLPGRRDAVAEGVGDSRESAERALTVELAELLRFATARCA